MFVTDHPASGRSCFQVLDVAAARPGAPLATVDLHYVHDFDVYLTTAQEYEGLVRQIFPLLRLGGGVVRSTGAASYVRRRRGAARAAGRRSPVDGVGIRTRHDQGCAVRMEVLRAASFAWATVTAR